MAAQINLDAAADQVREFFIGLGAINEPIELVSGGVVVARLAAASALSAEEKQRIVAKGCEVVTEARANARGISAADIQKIVDRAVCEVRARAAQRNR